MLYNIYWGVWLTPVVAAVLAVLMKIDHFKDAY